MATSLSPQPPNRREAVLAPLEDTPHHGRFEIGLVGCPTLRGRQVEGSSTRDGLRVAEPCEDRVEEQGCLLRAAVDLRQASQRLHVCVHHPHQIPQHRLRILDWPEPNGILQQMRMIRALRQMQSTTQIELSVLGSGLELWVVRSP